MSFLRSRYLSLRQNGTEPTMLAGGILTLGISTYVFLLIAGRQLGDERYAPLGAMWMLVFLVCPGLFFPIEQELGRAIAERRARSQGAAPIVASALRAVCGLVMVVAVLAMLTTSLIGEELFDDQWLLQVGLFGCVASFAGMYVVRGMFAGSHRLADYGVIIGVEGVVRVLGAVALVLWDVESPGPYGIVVALAPFSSVVVAWVLARRRHLLDPGPEAKLSEITASIGTLIAGSLLSQALVNSAPLIVKYFAPAGRSELSGAFTKAVILTRIPLFLFQAVQAAMLPRLTALATRGEHESFRSFLRVVVLGVGAIGLVGVAAAAILGEHALELFGSESVLPRTDVVLLAAGNAAFLLCMTIAQALVAVSAQRQTVIGWSAGVVVFVATTAFPGDIVRRVESALLAGAVVAFATMLVLLVRRLRRIESDVSGVPHFPLDVAEESVREL